MKQNDEFILNQGKGTDLKSNHVQHHTSPLLASDLQRLTEPKPHLLHMKLEMTIMCLMYGHTSWDSMNFDHYYFQQVVQIGISLYVCEDIYVN